MSIPPSIMTEATWMPFGPSSRAMLCAIARAPNFAAAKAANCAPPLSEAVAPVNRIVPAPRGDHVPRRFAPEHECAKTGQPPDLFEHIPGDFQHRLAMIRAGIEDCRGQDAVAVNRMLKRRDHPFLITDISGEAHGDPALATNRIGEPIQLILRTCEHHHRMPCAGETSRQSETKSFTDPTNHDGAEG
jgi:hypothetical protein